MQQQQQEPLNFDKVWKMFQETADRFKETDKKFQDTDKKFQDTDRRFKDTDKKFLQSQEELRRNFQETDKRFKETDKKVKELASLFTGQWGKLVEALMAPGCLQIFQERDINISKSLANIKAKIHGNELEIDLLLVNNDELVIIEIKTTARVKYIKELINDIKTFKTFFPEYSGHKVYGAIAAIRYEEDCDKLAASKGLFVIRSVGEGLVEISNPAEFQPAVF